MLNILDEPENEPSEEMDLSVNLLLKSDFSDCSWNPNFENTKDLDSFMSELEECGDNPCFSFENNDKEVISTTSNIEEARQEDANCIIIILNDTDLGQSPIVNNENMDSLLPISNKSDEKQNLEPTSEIKRHKCLICGYTSNRRDSVQTHVKSVHLKLEQFKCNLCNYATRHKSILNRHKNNLHVNPNKLKCQLCDSPFSTMSDLKNHKDNVHPNFRHNCHLCDYTTGQRNVLKSHIDSVHLNLREHKCDLCDYAGNRKSDLKGHMEAVHLNLKQHKCDECDFAANRKGDLKSHIELVHLKLKNYKCHLCDRATYRKKDLIKHLECVHRCKTILDPISNKSTDTCGIFTLEFEEL